MIEAATDSVQAELQQQRALVEDLVAGVREIKQDLAELVAAVGKLRGAVEDARTEARVARLRTERWKIKSDKMEAEWQRANVDAVERPTVERSCQVTTRSFVPG
jgi:hypothetical protein